MRLGAGQTAWSCAGWRVNFTKPPTPRTADHQASVFALGNGLLGVRGGCEEQAGGAGGAFLSAVFDRTPIAYHERFSGFAAASDTRVPVADGAQLIVALADGATLGEIAEFDQSLDMAGGRSARRTVWRARDGARVEILAERIVPLDGEAVLAIRFRLTSIDYRGAVSIRSQLAGGRRVTARGDDPRIGADHGARMDTLSRTAEGLDAVLTQKSGATAIRTACAQTHRLVAGIAEVDAFVGEAETCGALLHAHLAPGESMVVEKVVAYAHGADADEAMLVALALASARRQAERGFDALAAEQAQVLSAFWERAQVDIPATPELEGALRYNLFQLRQNAPRDGKTGIAAKGLSGEGYEGHCFWDAEVFATPVLAVTAPELARSHLMFRAATLDQARGHAREMNHPRGALFPWRTIAGDEASAYFPGGSAQYHINAGIAFAVQLYDRATGDEAFLIAHGAELVLETARIWLQVGDFNARRDGAFCISGVTGPDEYTALIDNDHYTNRLAKAHLEYAGELVRRLQVASPEAALALLARLGIEAAEIDAWARAAQAMYLPVDRVLGVRPQDDTFLDRPEWDFAGSAGKHPLLLHYHPLTLYRRQVCKQASVVLAHTLTPTDDLAQKQRDFDYYETVTVHDSTLSAASFAILAAEIGEMDRAAAYLHDTSFVDLANLHGNTDHGLHLAAAAGSWMALVWGWGGFRPQGETPGFRPVCSPEVAGYGFRILWRGRRLAVQVTAASVTYSLVEGAPLTIEHDGASLRLAVGAPIRVPTPAPRSRSRPTWVRRALGRPAEAAVIDLDGVLTSTAQAHYLAWKRIADELDAPFDEAANEALKGVDRMASLDILLGRARRTASAAERQVLADRKNGYYRQLIADFGPGDLLPGARDALEAARRAQLKLALASSSRNAPFLIERLGIAELFDHIVDAAAVRHGKPNPEIYLSAAAALGVEPGACIGLEDARAGVQGLLAAGMYAVGVGDPAVLDLADAVVGGIDALRWEHIFCR
jgi:alpha,alpha-trehalose phosphorylase